MFERILVPLDGSLRAERAIPVAAHLASASHSSILLVRVIDLFLDFPWQMTGVYPDPSGALEVARASANAYLEEVAKGDALRSLNVLNWLSKRLRQDPQVGPTVEITSSISLQSNVSETLVKLAEIGAEMEGVGAFTGYDLIAMATHGREGGDRWLHTSVTEQVLDATTVPVLVLRPEQAETGMTSGVNHDQCGSLAV